MNDEIRRVISGESQVRYGANIQAAIRYLTGSAQTGALDKTEKHFKRQETERLKQYIENEDLWINDIDLNNYISEGAEQRGISLPAYFHSLICPSLDRVMCLSA